MKRCTGGSLARSPLLVAGCLVVASVATGCLFNNSTGGSQSDGDAGMQADVDPLSCSSKEDCDSRPGTTVACTEGRCEYTCTDGNNNIDGDMSNGCECAADNTKRAWADCDGDNYPGTVEGDPSAEDSPRVTRYCTAGGQSSADGAPEAACDDDVGQWVSRNPSEDDVGDCNDQETDVYPGYPGENSLFEEGWLCDGLDNDCDDTADEPCCTAGNNGEFDFGAGGFEIGDGKLLNIVRPSDDSSPDPAVAAAFWVSGGNQESTLHARYLGPNGVLPEPELDRDISDGGLISYNSMDIRQLEVVPTGNGYTVMLAVHASALADQEIEIRGGTMRGDFSDLSLTSSLEKAAEIGGFDAFLNSTTQNVLFAVGTTKNYEDLIGESPTYDFSVKICRFTSANPGQCELGVLENGDSLPSVAYPQLSQIGDRYLVGWMNADRREVQVVQLTTDGSGFSVERRDEVEVSLENRNKNLRIDLFTHRDGDKELVDVVFPTLDQNSSWTALAYTRRNIDGFSLEKEGILAPAGDDFGHQTPDVAYDRENDQLAVVWRRVTSGAASLGVGKYPLSNPSMLESSMLSNSGLAAPSDAGAPVLQRVERGFAGGWTYGGATTWAHYLSSEVRPICTPTNSSGN